jgi:hypothetical protein
VEIAPALVRTLSSLAPFSIFADCCSILAMAIVIKDDYSSFQRLDKGLLPNFHWQPLHDQRSIHRSHALIAMDYDAKLWITFLVTNFSYPMTTFMVTTFMAA